MAKYILSLIIAHFSMLFNYLDPISTDKISRVDNLNQSKWCFKFVLPLLAVTIASLHGNVYLVYECEGNLNWVTMLDSPCMFYKQVFPLPMWKQAVPIHALSTVIVVVAYASFLRNPVRFQRYRFNKRGNHLIIGDVGK